MTPADKVKFEDLDREMEDFTKTMTTEDKAAFKELKPKTVNDQKKPDDNNTNDNSAENSKPLTKPLTPPPVKPIKCMKYCASCTNPKTCDKCVPEFHVESKYNNCIPDCDKTSFEDSNR